MAHMLANIYIPIQYNAAAKYLNTTIALSYHYKMTANKNLPPDKEKDTQLLEEICEHAMAIRRVTNRILDHLHEYHTGIPGDDGDNNPPCDPDEWSLDDMDDYDDMYL